MAAQRGEPEDPSSGTTYHDCANTHTGVLRIIDVGQQCADHESSIQLSGGASDATQVERIEALEEQVTVLQGEVGTLRQENIDEQTAIDDLVSRVTALEANIPPYQRVAALPVARAAAARVALGAFRCRMRIGAGDGARDTRGAGRLAGFAPHLFISPGVIPEPRQEKRDQGSADYATGSLSSIDRH